MSFAAGQPLVASDLNMITMTNADPTLRTTTAPAYTTTLTAANICGTSFTAPPSGKVMIYYAADMANSGANFTASAPQVNEGSVVGSGTPFQAASDNVSISTDSTTFESQGRHTLVTGLTAGAVYNTSMAHRVAGGTGSYLRREITVIPQLA